MEIHRLDIFIELKMVDSGTIFNFFTRSFYLR